MRNLLTALFLLATLPANAQGFQPSDMAVFQGWPGLEGTGFDAGAEAKVLAIVDKTGVGPRTIYVVLHDNNRSLSPVGVMTCSDRFEVLASEGNGWHDILCGDSGFTSVWVMGAGGNYLPQ